MRETRLQLIFVGVVALGAMLGTSTTAQAQSFVSPLIGYDFGGNAGCEEITDCEDKTLNLGVSLGRMGGLFGFEEEFAYAKDFFGEAPGFSSSVLTVMSNVMLVPKIGPVRPYFLVGVGLIKTHVEFVPASLLTVDNNLFGWDIGGGIIGMFGEHVGVRGDIRYFHSFQDLEFQGFTFGDEKFDFGRASAALIFAF